MTAHPAVLAQPELMRYMKPDLKSGLFTVTTSYDRKLTYSLEASNEDNAGAYWLLFPLASVRCPFTVPNAIGRSWDARSTRKAVSLSRQLHNAAIRKLGKAELELWRRSTCLELETFALPLGPARALQFATLPNTHTGPRPS